MEFAQCQSNQEVRVQGNGLDATGYIAILPPEYTPRGRLEMVGVKVAGHRDIYWVEAKNLTPLA